jgi:hypothetical protein
VHTYHGVVENADTLHLMKHRVVAGINGISAVHVPRYKERPLTVS